MVVGNLLLSWAGQLFVSCGLPRGVPRTHPPLWAVLARELVAGSAWRSCAPVACRAPRASLEIIRFKSAKYTVERPLHIGATLGGGPARLLATFTDYGVPMGEAFQLQDDLLGVFGDPRRTGKSNLDDISGHKPTALLAVALARADSEDREQLLRMLGDADLDDDDLRAVREILERIGARARIESMIEDRAAAARRALEPSAAARG